MNPLVWAQERVANYRDSFGSVAQDEAWRVERLDEHSRYAPQVLADEPPRDDDTVATDPLAQYMQDLAEPDGLDRVTAPDYDFAAVDQQWADTRLDGSVDEQVDVWLDQDAADGWAPTWEALPGHTDYDVAVPFDLVDAYTPRMVLDLDVADAISVEATVSMAARQGRTESVTEWHAAAADTCDTYVGDALEH